MNQAAASPWFRIRLAWFWTKRLIGILFLTVIGWDFLKLIGPGQVIEQAVVEEFQSTFPFKLFVKEDPAKIQAKIEEEARQRALEAIQARCRHITQRRGLWNYFCPLCGKKLIPDIDPPMWQI